MIKPKLIHYVAYWDGPVEGICQHNGKYFFFKMIEEGEVCERCNHPQTPFSSKRIEWLENCELYQREIEIDVDNFDWDKATEEDFCSAQRYRLYGMYEVPFYELCHEMLSHKIFRFLVCDTKLPNFLWYKCLSKLMGRPGYKVNHGKLVERFETFLRKDNVDER